MKSFIIVLVLMLPVTATAQNQDIGGNNIEKVMQLTQKLEQCMAKVDQAEMDTFEKESEKIGDEIEMLCSKGDRNKAQKKAIAFGKKAMKNSAILQMQKCEKITKGLLSEQAIPSFTESLDFSNRNVCEE